MKKILLLGSFLVFLCLIFTKAIWAQGACTARKNVATQSCELDSNNCQNHYWVHERNNQCTCDCVECTTNSHCEQLYGSGYACSQHSCYKPGGGSCSNFDPNTSTPGDCPAGLYPIITGPSTTSGLYQCACVECTQDSHCCPASNPDCGNTCDASNHCQPVPYVPPGPGGGEGGSIRTAIGDIDPRNLQGFIQSLLGIAFGVAGGIAFLLMLFGSFQIMTSSGNPEKMKAGSELITSALTGLLFIVFSVFLLKLIGVTILDIPGLKP